MTLNDLCFVDMPFGRKIDLTSGVEINFDQIYKNAIKPAIEAVGLEALRGDEEAAGGIIHGAMFARLLLAEYVVADLTTANPNVYYELGIRHAARPFTTVPIFATIHALPFDIALIRAVPYQIKDGKLTKAQAGKLQRAIEARLRAAIQGPPTKDSPLFELVPDYPIIDLPHEVTEAFQDRVRHSDAFNGQLAKAREKPSDPERRDALLAIQNGLGDLKVVQRNILVELLLSYRAVEAWPEMVALADAMPEPVQDLTVVRQQRAMALNRCGERERALKLLERLIKDPTRNRWAFSAACTRTATRRPRRRAASSRPPPSTTPSTPIGRASRPIHATTIPESTRSPCSSRRGTRTRSPKPIAWCRW